MQFAAPNTHRLKTHKGREGLSHGATIAWHHGLVRSQFSQPHRASRLRLKNCEDKAEAKAHEMAARNPRRIHLVEKLEKLVESYNLV